MIYRAAAAFETHLDWRSPKASELQPVGKAAIAIRPIHFEDPDVFGDVGVATAMPFALAASTTQNASR